MNKEKNKIKKLIKILIFLLAVFYFLFIFYTYENSHLQNSSEELQGDKIIDFQSVEIIPYKVKVGDKQTTTVKIVSTEEVEKVFAQIPFEGSYDEVSLKLISGDGFDGIWQCEWIAHNTLTKEYTTTITAITKNSTQEKATSTWWDDTETTWLEGWTNRKKITVTENSGSTLTDYQVPIDITDALYDNTGLVGSWHFSEGSGTYVKDSSGNGNNGIITSATWTNNKEGEANSALNFNGTTDYVTVDDSLSLGNVMTVSLWMKLSSSSYQIEIIDLHSNSTNTMQMDFYSNKIRAFVNGIVVVECSFVPELDKWYHIAYTRTGTGSGTSKIYINGISQTLITDTAQNFVDNDLPLLIGKRETSGHYFRGSLDEIRIYNRALSDNEIEQLYGEGKGRLDINDLRFTSADGVTQLSYWLENDNKAWVKVPSLSASSNTNIYYYFGNEDASAASSVTNTFIREVSNLVGGWDFEEGSGQYIYDKSGNKNNGTLGPTSSVESSDPTYTTGHNANGESGGGLYFDGVYDYTDVPASTSLNDIENYSIALWVYNELGTDDYPTLFNKRGQSTSNGFFWSYTAGANEKDVRFQYADGTIYTSVTFYDVLGVSQWDFLVFTFDNSSKTLKLYVNGSDYGEDKTLTNSLPVVEGDLYIGDYDARNTNYNFKGSIDEFRIYNRTLTASEISDMYNNPVYSTGDYLESTLVHKGASSVPTCSISSQEEIEPTRSGVTGVSGGGPLMF